MSRNTAGKKKMLYLRPEVGAGRPPVSRPKLCDHLVLSQTTGLNPAEHMPHTQDTSAAGLMLAGCHVEWTIPPSARDKRKSILKSGYSKLLTKLTESVGGGKDWGEDARGAGR